VRRLLAVDVKPRRNTSRPSTVGRGQASKLGRVVETRGRRVLVRDDDGERVCFLAGHRAVIGDRVQWVDAEGEGGKLVAVEERSGTLERVDPNGREQVLAAHLTGILVTTAPQSPPFRAGLVDRYVVGCSIGGLTPLVVLNKVDQGVPAEVASELALREERGLRVLHTSAKTGEGLEALSEALAGGTWALVGHSGVGKTSLVAALLPNDDVGPVGDLSAYWGTGQHTTTASRIFSLPCGAEVVDSPGIRTFAPGRLTAAEVRLHFPGIGTLGCRYRGCLHRPDEDGCTAEDDVPAPLLASYRRMLAEVLGIEDRSKP
jgi:ribosome biogenesis GTPase / thiamine phosphate phosphatase